MASSFKIKLKLGPKTAAAEGSNGDGKAGAKATTPPPPPSPATGARAKKKRAAYSSSPEPAAQGSSLTNTPRTGGEASSLAGDASSLISGERDDDEEQDDDEGDSDDDEEGDDELRDSDGHSEVQNDSAGEERDELEDSPPPQPATSQQSTGRGRGKPKRGVQAGRGNRGKTRGMTRGGRASRGGGRGRGRGTGRGASTTTTSMTTTSNNAAKSDMQGEGSLSPSSLGGRRRSNLLDDLPKPIDEMTLAEIEALPPPKRRKGLKVRGFSGPGRGWRKGLKMHQGPKYGQESDSSRLLNVAPGTPASFSNSTKPKSFLARDALSKTGTPLRSASPYSRSSPAGADDEGSEMGGPSNAASAQHVKALKKRMAEELVQQKKKQQQTTAAAISAAQAGETRAVKAIVKGAPTVLPINKVPGSFVTVTALDKSKKPVRKWERRGREILSLGGRPWFGSTWITPEERQYAPPATEPAKTSTATGATTATAANGNSAAASGAATPAHGANTAGRASGKPLTPVSTTNSSTAMAARKGFASTDAAASTVAMSASSPLAMSPTTSFNPLLPPPRHTPSKTGTSAPGTPTTARASQSPVLQKATAASLQDDHMKDWRGSSAAFTMANRGRS